jgi:ATP-dependent helicase HrpB
MPLHPLPIDEVLPDVIAALRDFGNVVLRAPTGAGKTTRVPPAMWRGGLAKDGAILVLQPRRVAARATAARMASECGVELGREIGFQTRFERKVSRDSRIVCITEGILLRRLLEDSFLDGVAAVVFDEFHERNLASDLALGMVRQVQQSVRGELRIAVMSATLDPLPIAAYLGNCPAVESQGRTFPVAIEHIRDIDRRRLDELAAWGVHELLPRTDGDLLVFLPGVGEIRSTAKRLAGLRDQGLAVHQLYGDLPAEQQDAVLSRGKQRKVILSTNVAETSLTIEGVTGVVDTGLARIASYDEHSGLDRLQLMPISQASAEQRAGRAGRTAPGMCLRLWPEAAHRARPERETPEIRRVDLAGAALQLACWIEPDLDKFPWFEPPRPASLASAKRLLERLEALDEQGITRLGRELARMPLHPRLARMIVEGRHLGHGERVALGAALLSERDPVVRDAGPRRHATHTSSSDLLDRIVALETFEARRTLDHDIGALHRGGAEGVLRVRDQLLRQTHSSPLAPREDSVSRSGQSFRTDAFLSRSERATISDEAVLRAVLAGFPDRVAKRRELNSRRAVMVGGRGVRLAESSAVDQAELFVCLDVDGSQGEALVRQASAVRREWLPESLLTTRVDVFYDEGKHQLTARRRVLWDDVVLEESPASLPEGEATTQALVAAANEHWTEAFPSETDAIAGFVQRVRFLAAAMPELNMPRFDDDFLRSLLPDLCQRRRSLDEVRRAPWLDYLRGALTFQQQQTLDREAPERFLVPSGNRIAIDYSGERPVLAVRIQELFGLSETPRLAGGRVSVLLHLLAPNMRPQQITDDLKSFWNNTYQQVRKDLRGRYPKHAWPEDPWNAVAQSRPHRR